MHNRRAVTMEIRIIEANMRPSWNWAQKMVFTIYEANAEIQVCKTALKGHTVVMDFGIFKTLNKSLKNKAKCYWYITEWFK